MPSVQRLIVRAIPALLLSGFVAAATQALTAQEANPTSGLSPEQTTQGVAQKDGIYLYRVKVVQRDLDAVNYLHRSGSTRIGFKGTTLLPGASGEAKVTSERGGITIDARFKGLPPANGFGPEYLTYVLWAISPDGRPSNLGEVLPAGDKNNITVTTSLQSFGMIVTAEPYFSVSQPSDVVVLQNVVLEDRTQGVLEKVNAHYSLLPRGLYAQTDGSNTVAAPITRDEKSPLELYQAYNAIRIAKNAGADKYAADIMQQAGPPQRGRHRQQQKGRSQDGDHLCPPGSAASRRCPPRNPPQAGRRAPAANRGRARCRPKGGRPVPA